MIEMNHQRLSVRHQCQLLELNRSNLYYEAVGESAENIHLMNILDEEYTRHPFLGVEKMTRYLHDLGYRVNVKRVRRLLRKMGIEAIYPKKNLSKPHPEHKIYPYLLRDMAIIKPNQVWCTDITYIRMAIGFGYLVAIMDWYSRFVLSWRLSNSLDASFCVEALEEALLGDGQPEIFNTDQGVQFTSEDFTSVLLSNNIKISMDGRGRYLDNIFQERLWRSVKYEEVYLHDYQSMSEARAGLRKYLNYYNVSRHHQGLEYKKPAEVYFAPKSPVDYGDNGDNTMLVPRTVAPVNHVGPQET